jgi:hypothetical protein
MYYAQRNASGSDVTKHFWNIKIMGHPSGEVLKMVTSQHCQPFTNFLFYQQCDINPCPINTDYTVHRYKQHLGADQLTNTLCVCVVLPFWSRISNGLRAKLEQLRTTSMSHEG